MSEDRFWEALNAMPADMNWKDAINAAAEVALQKTAVSPSHPDCKRCKQIREQTRKRVQKVRAKK